MKLTSIDGKTLKKMFIAGANMLDKNKDIIDALNVFPVPDGDTGTNMSMTAIAAAKEAENAKGARVCDVAAAASGGSLRGARGNSGVILSQLFRGFAKGLSELDAAHTADLARAARKAVDTAYKAVMKPKEGTILTVAREIAARAERSAAETDDVSVFLAEIIEEGETILAKTTEMLPSLKQANVVDAGGQGLLCVLRGAYAALSGDFDYVVTQAAPDADKIDYSALSSITDDEITFTYCTEFFVNMDKNAENEEETESAFKSYLDSIGDSIVAVCDGNIIKIHVHTNNPGQALEKALTIGSLSNIKIENMRFQHTEKISFAPNAVPSPKKAARKKAGFAVVSSGAGFADIFKSLGADAVIEGGQSMNPSTSDIIKAVESINAENVFVFPNNKNIILAAQQAAKLIKTTQTHVIPSRSVPQGITALCAHSETESAENNAKSMAALMDTVHSGQVTFAVRNTIIDGREIKEGDALCMLDGEIAHVTPNAPDGAKLLIDDLLTDECEILTIYRGEDGDEQTTDELAAYAAQRAPRCEIETRDGGQPVYLYIISAE